MKDEIRTPKASGSADNTDAVHSSSREQTGDIPFKQLYGFATAALDKIYDHNEACRQAVIEHYGLYHYPFNENFKDWIASQAPTDSAVQQEGRTEHGKGGANVYTPVSASPQTSEVFIDEALDNAITALGQCQKGTARQFLQSAIDADGQSNFEWLRGCYERLKASHDNMRAGLESIVANSCCDRCREAALVAKSILARSDALISSDTTKLTDTSRKQESSADAAARVEPTKKYNRLTNLDIENNRLRFRLLESNAALEVAYKFGLSKRLESVGEIIDKNNEELNASCAPKTQDETKDLGER